MMSCQEVRERLSAYLDRALGAQEQAAVSNHVAACAPCRSEQTALLQVKELIRAQSMPAMPPDLAEAIADLTLRRPRPWAGWIRWIPLATGSAAAALAVWALWRGAPGGKPGLSTPLPVVQAPAAPARVRVVLHHVSDDNQANDLQ